MAAQSTPWQRGEVVAAELRGGRRPPDRAEANAPEHAAPGSHIDVELGIRRPGPQVRSYSDRPRPRTADDAHLGVQLSPTPAGGWTAMHTLAVGARVTVTGPLQNFPLAVGAGRYVLVAGGIGITALAAMASALRRRRRRLHTRVSSAVVAGMAYLDQLSADTATGSAARRRRGHAVRCPDLVADIAGADRGHDRALHVRPDQSDGRGRREWRNTRCRRPTCGSRPSAPAGGSTPRSSWCAIPQPAARSWSAPTPRCSTRCDAAGVDAMSDCRKGECGLCLADVARVDGAIDHRDVFLSEAQKQRCTNLCLCVSRAVAEKAGDRATVTLHLT